MLSRRSGPHRRARSAPRAMPPAVCSPKHCGALAESIRKSCVPRSRRSRCRPCWATSRQRQPESKRRPAPPFCRPSRAARRSCGRSGSKRRSSSRLIRSGTSARCSSRREPHMALNRSFLFAPGNVPRRVEKALTLEADAVIVDLEDSVAPAEKAATRKAVAEALMRPRRGRGYVRVNAASTPYCYGDLVATIHKGVDGVVLPKVESAGELHAIDWLLSNLEREHGLAEGSIDLMPQIETAAGVQRIERIVQAKNLRAYKGPWRVKRVTFGAGDYANDVGLSPSLEEPELAEARARIVMISRAAGLENPIDSPWFHLKEPAGFARALERSRRGGFQGRLCIHPDQIGPVNAAYLPSPEDLAQAERIVSAFREAEAKGAAAIQVDGQMIDYPIVHRAQALLDSVARSKK